MIWLFFHSNQQPRKGSDLGYHVLGDNFRYRLTLHRTWSQLKIDAHDSGKAQGGWLTAETGGKQLFWDQVPIHKSDQRLRSPFINRINRTIQVNSVQRKVRKLGSQWAPESHLSGAVAFV